MLIKSDNSLIDVSLIAYSLIVKFVIATDKISLLKKVLSVHWHQKASVFEETIKFLKPSP